MSFFSFRHFLSPSLVQEQSARDARSEARAATTEVQLLRGEVDRLYMITEALWSLLKEQGSYDDQSLAETIHQIDLRDGKLDGRVSTTEGPRACSSCGRTTSKKRPLCMYCGNPVEGPTFER